MRNTTTIQALPTEMLSAIFVRLPVVSVTRCALVRHALISALMLVRYVAAGNHRATTMWYGPLCWSETSAFTRGMCVTRQPSKNTSFSTVRCHYACSRPYVLRTVFPFRWSRKFVSKGVAISDDGLTATPDNGNWNFVRSERPATLGTTERLYVSPCQMPAVVYSRRFI